MGNNYFRFKRFTIYQDKCAMKVGTDGVLLGAWSNCSSSKNVLDIGTGTGLVALMIAQRSMSKIDAIEIEKNAVSQATINIVKSPWKDRISIEHTFFQDFYSKSLKKYDLIVSNPPYFTNSSINPDIAKTFARHNQCLKFSELIEGTSKLLSKNGKFNVIIPADQSVLFTQIAKQHKLYLSRVLNVRPTANKPVKRVIFELSHVITTPKISELIIELDQRHHYSADYIDLTKDYYL